MELSFSQFTQWLGFLWWPFVRIAGLFLITPFFGDNAIPVRTKLVFAFFLAILLAPLIKDTPPLNPFSFDTVLFTSYQFLFGFILGLAVMMFFTVFSIAGQAISMQMGLAMAVMNDPANGINIAIIGRVMFITSMLLFLSLDAHLVILLIFKDSFHYWPLDSVFPFNSIEYTIKMVSWMFANGLLIAIPAIIVMLLSNITFGLMNKAAPALNVFALGFPMTMLLGLFALMASVTGIGDHYFDLVVELNDHLYYLLRIPNG
ncbi:flagellar biosynthetic protein FliR [Photobacterium sp. BZF1]|uniref:flagellar biosynthetic protein FliR n=1 Tax=Photobacterium sp. BZF1 TaxID=1904457 RepID=UPI00165360B8|nr:flagellar biosynthetic protein FliR [Photobacterium sp. BZF1]MBC7001591.1 flagellar biosynthetic protein FliR [Photobacterium sp. BZF1]